MASPSDMPLMDERTPGSREERPSGVHPCAASRLLVLERPSKVRGDWAEEAVPMGRVETVSTPEHLRLRLHHARSAVRVAAVVGASTARASRSRLVIALGHAIAEAPVTHAVADLRRCDLESATTLLLFGFVLYSDDAGARLQAHRAAWGDETMAHRWHCAPGAQRRLAKMLGATEVSDRIGLSATQHRMLRALLDTPNAAEVAKVLGVSASTARGHAAAIRAKAGTRSLDTVLREAHDASVECAFQLGNLRL